MVAKKRGMYRYVGTELRVVRARRLPERVFAVHELLLVKHLVLRMHENGLDNGRVAEEYGEQQNFANLLTVRFAEQDLHDLQVLILGGEAESGTT